MSWVLDFATNIPFFLIYVVPGYLFLSVYRFVLSKDENTPAQTSYLLLNSIIASFVLKTLYDIPLNQCLGHSSDETAGLYLVGILAMSVCAGTIAANAARSPRLLEIFQKIGFNRTLSENVWDDFLEGGQWLRIWIPDSDRSYYGQIAAMENYSREPLILLKNYQFLDDDATVLIDNSADETRTVLLNLSKFERVEIVDAEIE